MTLVYPTSDGRLKRQHNILPFTPTLCLTKYLFRIYRTIQRYLCVLGKKNDLLLIGMAYGRVIRRRQFLDILILYWLWLPPFPFLQLLSQALYSKHHNCCIYSVALWMTSLFSPSRSRFFNGSDGSEDNEADTLIQKYPVYVSAVP